MTAAEMAALRALAEAATPGPWLDGFKDGSGAGSVVTGPTNDTVIWNADILEEDAAYIAAVNPAAVLALLDEVARLREAITRHRRDVWGCCSVGDLRDIELYAALGENRA